MEAYDVVIVGAGPAGLAAACAVSVTTKNYLLLDEGVEHFNRKRNSPEDLASGVGGAGLFSDGKYSFYPASTNLWNLRDQEQLKRCYEWASSIFESFGMKVPPFQTTENDHQKTTDEGVWIHKKYPSNYLDFSKRMKMTKDLYEQVQANILLQTRFLNWNYDSNSEIFTVNIKGHEDDKVKTVMCKRLVLAGGRYFPLTIQSEKSFLRLELGVRIQDHSNNVFWTELQGVDPKYIFKEIIDNEMIEWRTFCCCREGEVVGGKSNDIWSYSGRADCPPTGYSNIGFNLRISRSNFERDDILLKISDTSSKLFKVNIKEFLNENSSISTQLIQLYGEKNLKYLRRGIHHLMDKFPSIENADIFGITLEGVGMYPQVDNDLKVKDLPIWVVGDACGLFRGLVAAMISGYYVGAHIVHSS